MRWWIGTAVVVLAGVVAFAYAPARKTDETLPTITVHRSNLVESTVALGTIKPMVGAEVKVGLQLACVMAKMCSLLFVTRTPAHAPEH